MARMVQPSPSSPCHQRLVRIPPVRPPALMPRCNRVDPSCLPPFPRRPSLDLPGLQKQALSSERAHCCSRLCSPSHSEGDSYSGHDFLGCERREIPATRISRAATPPRLSSSGMVERTLNVSGSSRSWPTAPLAVSYVRSTTPSDGVDGHRGVQVARASRLVRASSSASSPARTTLQAVLAGRARWQGLARLRLGTRHVTHSPYVVFERFPYCLEQCARLFVESRCASRHAVRRSM